MKQTAEAAFETAIESVLLGEGYVRVDGKGFDRERAIFPDEALAFVRTTQGKVWEKLEVLHGEQTGARVLESLCKWLDTHGTLATLRHGFKCFGRTLRIAFFRPAHGLNPELEARYRANRLGLTRQLHCSPKSENSLDVVLSVNGIPLVTLELKNPLSGQTAANAIHQYRHDRDPREPIFVFTKRALVHFAVDTEEAHMATRLAGSSTHFLPFNRGLDGGAGNPPDRQGRNYKTAYLWEEVLQRDSLLDLLARFLHLNVEEKITDEGKKVRKETMIFPRYHQLQAVRRMVAAAASEGVGHNYLVEHSAGSGKSNTIGWLAHRLSSLHNDRDERIFDSVVVITDRVVLDRQLQNTIYQFDHRQGVVQKIDEDSRQLAEALEAGVPIIITTLQKFPFVSGQLAKLNEERGVGGKSHLPTRKYAVILDEAHSSQSGETATELKGVLGGAELRKKAQEMAEEEGEVELDASGIYLLAEVAEFASVFFAPKRRQSPSDHKAMNAILDQAVARFVQMQGRQEEEAELWRGKVQAFHNLYSFLSQVTPYQDSDLEKLFTYLRHLALKLPKRKGGPGYRFDEEVELDYYRMQKINEGSINLREGYAKPLDGPREVGTGMVREEQIVLSRLIDLINERFGGELTEADQLFFDQITEAAVQSEALRKAAEVNSFDKFQLVFRQVLESLFIERMELNEDLFTDYMSKPDMQELVAKWLGSQVYDRLSGTSRESPQEQFA